MINEPKEKGESFFSTHAKNSVTGQISLTVKLVLDNIVERLEKEEHEVMVLRRREQEPAGGEGLQQVEQFIGCHHGQALQVGRHCRRGRNNKRTTVKLNKGKLWQVFSFDSVANELF